MVNTTAVPVTAAVLLLLLLLFITFKRDTPAPHAWLVPAGLSLLFFAFSLQAVFTEGALGFWAEHVRNLWGNQIFLDLLLMASIAWYFVIPQARVHGMRVLLWLILIICTGSIGFLAMVARLLYLQKKAGHLV